MISRPRMLNERQDSLAGKILSAVCTLVLVILIAFTVLNLWFVSNYFVVEVDGRSMCDTLQDGDMLYAKKTDLHAERGDIVIIDVTQYHLFDPETERIIKRLIAVEGDFVKCERGVVYLKKAGEEEYVALDKPSHARGEAPDFSETQVRAGQIFVLGDNQPTSFDSADVGCLNYKDIVGIVPAWAVKIKSFSTMWETQRGTFISATW